MEAPEVPTEQLHEELHHRAEHAKEKWITGVALSSAIVAALAALASLLAGANANMAMIDQMQASDQWNYFQAKGVKATVLSSKLELLTAQGKEADQKDQAKAAEYKADQEGIKKEAEEKQEASRERLEIHETLALSVTIFQVSIAVSAIAALARRRSFWYVSLVAAVAGTVIFGRGLGAHRAAEAKMHAAEQAEAAHAAGSGEHAH